MTPFTGASQDDEHVPTRDTCLSRSRRSPRKSSLFVLRMVSVLSAVLFVFLAVGTLPHSQTSVLAVTKAQSHAVASGSNPGTVCSGCHKEIYEKYERTPMARGSGAAVETLQQGGFLHGASGIRYNVFLRNGEAWMSYVRELASGTSQAQLPLRGEKQLVYFIGSGHRGRTYLYKERDQWFEAPINYYSKKKLWDMAPNFGAATTMPAALPVDSNCLHCHATGVQTALPEARNMYAGPPFEQGGIGCSACHGDPSKHLAQQGHGTIVNPAKLIATRRDSTCLQCHLEGDVAVYRAGRSLAQFRAGDDLTGYVAYFVKAGAESGGRRASSQYEALLRSACKVASGDKLTCTTCHDPHSSPNAEERVDYFRSKCLTCHTGSSMATQHHPEQRDCAACHMPTRELTDISHEQATDHNIQRRPLAAGMTPRLKFLKESDELLPVGALGGGDRELGLAYAQLAEGADQRAGKDALRLLKKAEDSGANDVQLHSQLGVIEQMTGDMGGARKEYAEALMEDSYDATALGNLAVLDATSGQTANAVKLLQRVIEDDPSQMTAGLDLAFIDCKVGEKKKALEIVQGLLQFNPDDPTLRMFLTSGIYAGARCDLR